jgi:diguanylate cyclase (GGDEF)-like protein
LHFRLESAFHDITEHHKSAERIRHLAFHDVLTGLPNRTLFQDRLEHALERAKRENNRLSVTFVDLDGFKAVNDSLGHDVGDMLLQEVATRIRSRLRRGADTVARLGGDEFVVLMENLKGPEHCAFQAECILEDILEPIEIRGHSIRVGASLGMAFYPEDGNEALQLMKCADAAMYSAKAAGKGTYRFFQPDMLTSISTRLSLETELRQAIAE